ncbi:MAG TPA: sigma factor-like helix-turn-helix DNA-binding protein [Solirubrobacteraceae bacterium]|jgi:hypothetical protein|nr:sigma factor-like helix-turn-helix DNA-binding protein [Solirubrobacteraceae bacterium]
MTEQDRLPPDQRAVLSLVLDRGKSYAEVATLLSIPETTVRERAHAALDALATAGESPVRSGTTAVAAGSAAGSAAEVAADAAQPVRASALGGEPPMSPPPRLPSPSGAGQPSGAGRPSSRRGGALLLAGILVVAIVVAIVLSSGGGGDSKGSSAKTASSTTAGTGSTGAAKASTRIDNKIALTPPEPESKALGEAYVLSDGARHAFYVAAKSLPPSQGFFYAVWLYNSPSSAAPLGRAPAVSSDGRLEGGGPLPSNAANYAKLIVTRETNTHATHPGSIVLSGSFSLH